MKRVALSLFLFLFLSLNRNASAQNVPVHFRNEGIYDFLDELNAHGFTSLDLTTGALSSETIRNALYDVAGMDTVPQNSRIGRSLQNYMQPLLVEAPDLMLQSRPMETILYTIRRFPNRWVSADLFCYADSLFWFRIKPLLSYETYSNTNGTEYWRRSGLAFSAGVGKHWGFWGSLADNNESLRLSEETFITQRPGANYKISGEGGEYSEARGGISYAWDWGSLMMAKDDIRWGSGYHGTSIFSGRTPSFPFLKLNLQPVKWLEFNYFHGWLVSGVIDSSRTGWYTNAYGTERREYFYDKYIAANLFTLRPWKRLNISFGNSIIYSDDSPKFAFFIPFLFWKSVDHSLTAAGSSRLGQNSQMFFDISSYQLRKFHFYTSVFVDEVSFSRLWNKEEHSNFIGMKFGAAAYDLPARNFRIILEYTRNNPLTYRHNTPLTTFESAHYNLGSYLLDNADEVYFSLRWTPVPMGWVQYSYTGIRKGPDHTALGTDRLGLPFMESVVWSTGCHELRLRYELYANLSLHASWFSDWPGGIFPARLSEKSNIFSFGLNWNY